jgi:general secretion pathway protein D
MKMKNKLIKYFIALNLCLASPLYCQDLENETSSVAEIEAADIVFNYENEDITNIISKLAAFKNVNVIFPAGEILNTKVTLHLDEKITLSQAWNLLNTLLDVAGFFIVPQGNMVRIIKSGKEMSREPMTTYIGVHPDDLPNTDQPIRYLYYLSNIKVSDQPENELNGILKDILPENTLAKADPVTNGLLLVAKASDIRGVMRIIMELDRIDFQEKMDIIPLLHTSAGIVAELINQQLIKPESANPYRLDTKAKAKEIPYFSGFTKIIPEPRLNKLIILGRPQAVERLKDFIKQYIDVAPDTGKSILHVYHLQYLNASELARVLEKIIQGESGNGGPSQASAGDQRGGGTERFFDKVIIHTDSPLNQENDNANTPVKQQRPSFYGGNNLVVAARNDDWKQIKKLIEELDVPQKQVLIEVLIADLTVDDVRLLGSMTRMPDKVPLPDDIEVQSAMFGQVIPSELPPVPTTTIESDLLKNAYNTAGTLANPSSGATNNLATQSPATDFGTTMLSLNDNNGKTWSVWELQQLFSNSKILSHPHVIARNNKEATVSIGQTRWLTDRVKDISGNYYGGATTIKNKPIAANLVVKIIPRISSANTVNLQILVDINEWQDGPGNVKNIRTLETNANIKSGGIFALGGLIRTTTSEAMAEVPVLGKIPILGWFFKRKRKDVTKNNLTVFISPTVVEPRLRSGINEYTQDYIDMAKDYARGDLFDSLKDPITRWFFKGDADTAGALDAFAARDENLTARKRTIQDKELKKEKNYEFETIDSTDPIAEKTGISIAHNDLKQMQSTQQEIPDLKIIIRDDPNPFLKT